MSYHCSQPSPWGRFRFVCLPLGPSLCIGHLPMDDGPDPHSQQWSDWHLANDVVVHGRDDEEHDKMSP